MNKEISTAKNAKGDFELLAPQDAATEKKLALCQKQIKAFHKGAQRGAAQLFGYAFLCGHAMNQAKELLPHGQFEKWVAAKFPEIPIETGRNWRKFAEAIESKNPTVGFLTGGKGTKISKSGESEIVKIVPEVMDGMGMLEFIRSMGFLKEPSAGEGGERINPGGYHPDKEALEKFIAEKHPELSGTPFAKWPRMMQREFQKWDASPRLTPEAIQQATLNEFEHDVQETYRISQADYFARLTKPQLQAMKDAAQNLIDHLNTLLK
jgi:hypothetical protein